MAEATMSHGFTRRSFIKGVAAVTAAGAITGCTPKEDDKQKAGSGSSADELYAGVCRGNCAGNCLLDVHVRDGQIVRTTAHEMPDHRYTRICSKGLTQPARVYSSRRLQYPMRRIGERGEGEFERITWDEAIDEIATKWQGYIDEFGGSSVMVMTGTGNGGCVSGVGFAPSVSVFKAALGLSSTNFTIDAAHPYASGICSGTSLTASNNSPSDWKNSKTFICWGANPAVSQPQVMHFISEAKESGTRYIVIDPVYGANASKADWYVPVNATTDGVLAFGVINELFKQGWIDEDYVRASTEGPMLIKESDGKFLRMSDLGVEQTEGPVDETTGLPTVVDPYVVWDESSNSAVALEEAVMPAIGGVSEVDGIPVRTCIDDVKRAAAAYTVDMVTEITGIREEDVRELARIYHEEGPVNTYMMLGNDHYVNGHYNYRPIYAISALTGNAGKNGAACGYMFALPMHVANFAGAALPVDAEGNYAQGEGKHIVLRDIGNILDTKMYQGQPFELKSAYLTNINTVATMAERDYTIDWIKRLDFVVVADIVMTETARYADILLPASHWFESVDIYASSSTNPYLNWNDKAIDPLFESKPDFEIYKLILSKMGYGQFLDMDQEDYISFWLNTQTAQAMGITKERLKEEKTIFFLPKDEYVAFEGGVYGTASGRAKFYQDGVSTQYDIGQEIDHSKEQSLYWEPSLESTKGSSAREQYPFHLLSGHLRTRTHTQWWDVDCLKEVEPGPVVHVNPDDANEFSIVEGDNVKLFNDRGHVVLRAVIDSGVPRETLLAPRGYQFDEFVDGHFSDLSFKEYNQVCENQAVNDCAVGIQKL